MADTITIAGGLRTAFGKGAARRLRTASRIPATIYAGGRQPTFVHLPLKETTNALRRTNALFRITYGKDSKMAVVKDVQRNPVKRRVEHIDFLEVHAGEKIVVEVPVFVEGAPKGAAVAFVDIQNLQVRADATNLPQRIVVNVEDREDGDKILAKDLKLPEGAELVIDDLEDSIVTIEVPQEEVLETPTAPAATTAAAGTEAAPAEGTGTTPAAADSKAE